MHRARFFPLLKRGIVGERHSRPSGSLPIPPNSAPPRYDERCRTAQSPAESAFRAPVVAIPVALSLCSFAQVLYLSLDSVSLVRCIDRSRVPMPTAPLPIAPLRPHGAPAPPCILKVWENGEKGY